jgi:hypothetical protein
VPASRRGAQPGLDAPCATALPRSAHVHQVLRESASPLAAVVREGARLPQVPDAGGASRGRRPGAARAEPLAALRRHVPGADAPGERAPRPAARLRAPQGQLLRLPALRWRGAGRLFPDQPRRLRA